MAKPLVDVCCIEEEYCEYPIAVRITMDDGSVQTYTLDYKADLQFKKVMDSLDKVIGYQYRPKRRRNRIHRYER